EQIHDHLLRVVDGSRVARADALVQLNVAFVFGRRRVLENGRQDIFHVRIGIDVGKGLLDVFVFGKTEGAEQGSRGDFTLAVDADRDDAVVFGLELEPGAAGRD